MLSRLRILAKAGAGMPPPLLAAKATRRLGIGGAFVRRAEFLNAPDTSRSLKVPTILGQAMKAAGLDPAGLTAALPGARVMEVGCGRHFNFAPIAFVAGARSYVGVDPAADPALLADAAVRTRYIEPALKAAAELVRGQGAGSAAPDGRDFVAFLTLRREGLDRSDWPAESVDFRVSLSCLDVISQ